MINLRFKALILDWEEWEDDRIEEKTDNYTFLAKEEKISNCFIYTHLGKEIFLILCLQEWKGNRMEIRLMKRD